MTPKVKFNISVRGINSIDDAARVLTFNLGCRDVISHPKIFHGLAVVAQNWRDHGINVIGCTVFGTIFNDAPEDVAPANGGPQFLEGFLRHVRVPGGVMRLPNQLASAVLRDFNEFLVDADNIALFVGLGHDACEVHDVSAHLQLGLKVSNALLQISAIEQSRHPGCFLLTHSTGLSLL